MWVALICLKDTENLIFGGELLMNANGGYAIVVFSARAGFVY